MYKITKLLTFMYNFLKHTFNKKLDKPMSELCVYEIRMKNTNPSSRKCTI